MEKLKLVGFFFSLKAHTHFVTKWASPAPKNLNKSGGGKGKEKEANRKMMLSFCHKWLAGLRGKAMPVGRHKPGDRVYN